MLLSSRETGYSAEQVGRNLGKGISRMMSCGQIYDPEVGDEEIHLSQTIYGQMWAELRQALDEDVEVAMAKRMKWCLVKKAPKIGQPLEYLNYRDGNVAELVNGPVVTDIQIVITGIWTVATTDGLYNLQSVWVNIHNTDCEDFVGRCDQMVKAGDKFESVSPIKVFYFREIDNGRMECTLANLRVDVLGVADNGLTVVYITMLKSGRKLRVFMA